MAGQYYIIPAPVITNPSIGINGQNPAPTSSTEVGGINPAGALQPLQTTTAGSLIVSQDPIDIFNENVAEFGGNAVITGTGNGGLGIPRVTVSDDSSLTNITGTISLPTGASTATNQATEITALGTIATNQTNGTQETQIVGTVPLPTGAATAANQATEITALDAIEANQTNGTQITSVSNFPATQPVSGTVTANQGSANATPWNENIAQWGGSATTLGQKAMAASVPVAIASDQSAIPTTTQLVAAVYSGQKTSTGTAVAISTSQALQNGVVVQALSGNTASVFVGPSGITTSTGFELQPGQATGIATANLDLIFVISSSSGDGVCFVGS